MSLLVRLRPQGCPSSLVVCDRGNPSGSAADVGPEAAARVRGSARAADDGVGDVPQALHETPRSRGLSEHGVFSCEECCIPAHMQG